MQEAGKQITAHHLNTWLMSDNVLFLVLLF